MSVKEFRIFRNPNLQNLPYVQELLTMQHLSSEAANFFEPVIIQTPLTGVKTSLTGMNTVMLVF